MEITGNVNPKSPYTFQADSMKIGKPTADGNITVTFSTGLYEINNLAPLFLLQALTKTFTVTVQVND